MALFSKTSHYRPKRRQAGRQVAFESLEHRNMPAVLVDVGHHFVEPDTSGQTISLSVVSTAASDAPVAAFDLRAQIVTSKEGPYFEGVRFAGDLWNTFPHIESGSPFPKDHTLALGEVAFTHGFEAEADGKLVTLTIDTTGIPAGSYEFRLVGTKLGSSSFRRTDGSGVSEVITNGTLQVRSIWQNRDNPYDITRDGRVSPLDVLLLLNELSKKGSYELPMRSAEDSSKPDYDVNGDGYLSPSDPLGAINCLNGLGCNTTPQPILARVTPSFPPGDSDSTGVGERKPGDVPPDETDSGDPTDCVYYELDENGEPVPVFDPDFCDGVGESDPPPLPLDLNEPDNVDPANSSPSEEEPASIEGDPATPTAPALAPRLVDAVIFDFSKRISDEDTGEELVDLGLSVPSK